jgi:fermentation-respiration switch protein FrsA (DUF1100 family)
MRAVLILGLTILLMLVIVWTQQRKLMYFPFGHVPDPVATGLKGISAVTFSSSDGVALSGWFMTTTEAPRFTVVVFNGNAGNRAHRLPLAHAFAAEGLAVLLLDYRGFGGNPGSPTEAGLKADARGALNYLLRRPDVDPKRLVYFGESLGTAIAVDLAAEHQPAALILRSPFTSATDVARVHYWFLPVRWLLRDHFSSIDRIADVRAPLMVVAGDRDGIVPIDQSRRLYEAANAPKSFLVIQGADHNDDPLQAGRQMIEAVLRFLDANVN